MLERLPKWRCGATEVARVVVASPGAECFTVTCRHVVHTAKSGSTRGSRPEVRVEVSRRHMELEGFEVKSLLPRRRRRDPNSAPNPRIRDRTRIRRGQRSGPEPIPMVLRDQSGCEGSRLGR